MLRPGFAHRYCGQHGLALAARRVTACCNAGELARRPGLAQVELLLGPPRQQARLHLSCEGPVAPDALEDAALGATAMALVGLAGSGGLAGFAAHHPTRPPGLVTDMYQRTLTTALTLQGLLGPAAFADLLTIGRSYRKDLHGHAI